MKNIKKIIIIMLLLTLGSIISSCGIDRKEAPDIYVSIYPLEYVAKRIVASELTVASIYPRGKDVHDYELNSKDMIRLSKSEIIFYIGLGLEANIEDALDTTLKDANLIRVSEDLSLIEMNCENATEYSELDPAKFYDPHIWLDLQKMQVITNVMYEHIINTFELSREQKEFFRANADSLINDLAELDNEFNEVINDENVKERIILVDHDAYSYWQARYGLKRLRIRNDNESSDAVPKDLIEKIELAKSYGIKFICLTKNELVSRIAERYRTELKLGKEALLYLHHIASITTAEERSGEDYLSLMRYNLDIVNTALPKK